MRRRRQLGQAEVAEDVVLKEFVETYWRVHAVPNLAPSTRDFYARAWANHIKPRLGDYGVRELTPKRLARFREELERAGVGTATVRQTMAILQSILSFAVAERRVQRRGARAQATIRASARTAHLSPGSGRAHPPGSRKPPGSHARGGACVLWRAARGGRLQALWEDVGERAIRYRDTKRHRIRFTPLLTPLEQDLREWF
jgi:Phage integrase, N-terminal SAM-like domain